MRYLCRNTLVLLGLWLLAYSALPAWSQDGDATLHTGTQVTSVDVAEVQNIYQQARPVFEAYLQARRTAGDKPVPFPRDLEWMVARMYATAGEDAPAVLKGLLRESELSAEHGKLMWEVRQDWFETAVREVCREMEVSIGMLDSGTEGSVASDADKTLRILKIFKEEVGEQRFIEILTERVPQLVKARTGVADVSLVHLDIEVFSGKNLYPTWHNESRPAHFKAKVMDVLDKLKTNPAAYLTDSSIKMQVIRRAQEKERDLRQGALQEGAAFQHFAFDPEGERVDISQPDDWIDLLGLSKGLDPHDVFGSALGNHIMLSHKLEKVRGSEGHAQVPVREVQDDLAKYLMRAVMDTATVADPDKLQRLERYDMDDVPDEKSRRRLLADLCGMDPTAAADANESARLNQFRVALEISDKLLQNKKARSADPPRPQMPEDNVYREMAILAAGSPIAFQDDPERYLQEARGLYADVAEEASMRIMIHNVPDAVETWANPGPELRKRLLGDDPDNGDRKFRILGMALVKTACESLPPDQWKRLCHSTPALAIEMENMERMLAWGRPGADQAARPGSGAAGGDSSAGRRTGVASPDGAPRRRLDQQIDRMKGALDHLLKRFPVADAQAEGGRRAITSNEILDWTIKRASGLRDRVARHCIGSRLSDFAGRRARGAGRFLLSELTDGVGNLDAALGLIEVLQSTEHLSEADREAAMEQALYEELFSRIPYLGKARSFCRASSEGDVQGLVMILVPMLEQLLASHNIYAGPSGMVFMAVGMARTLVSVIGHEIFYPMRRDAIDLIFKGYMEPTEAGLLRAGRNIPEGFRPSQFPSITRRIPVRFAMLDGWILEWLLDVPMSYTVEKALVEEMGLSGDEEPIVFIDLEHDYRPQIDDLRHRLYHLSTVETDDEELKMFRELQVQELGRVLDIWRRQAVLRDWVLGRISTENSDFRLGFEVRRQNAYRYFRERVQRAWEELADDPRPIEAVYDEYDSDLEQAQRQEDTAETRQLVQDLKNWRSQVQAQEFQAARGPFLEYVEDWCQARGDFADYPENTALEFVWHDQATKEGLADRLANSYQGSRAVTFAAEGTLAVLRELERDVDMRLAQVRARNLAMLYEQALPRPDAELLEAAAVALAPGAAAEEPKVDLSAVVRNCDGEPTIELAVKVTANPAAFGVSWRVAGPWGFEPVARAAVPAQAWETLGLSPEASEGQVYRITLPVAGYDKHDREVGRATGVTWCFRCERPTVEPPHKPPGRKPPAREGPFILHLRKITRYGLGAGQEGLAINEKGFPVTVHRDEDRAHRIDLNGAVTLDVPDTIVLGETFRFGATFEAVADVELGDKDPRLLLSLFAKTEAKGFGDTIDFFRQTGAAFRGVVRGAATVQQEWYFTEKPYRDQVDGDMQCEYRIRRLAGVPGSEEDDWNDGAGKPSIVATEQGHHKLMTWNVGFPDIDQLRLSFGFTARGVGTWETDRPEQGHFRGLGLGRGWVYCDYFIEPPAAGTAPRPFSGRSGTAGLAGGGRDGSGGAGRETGSGSGAGSGAGPGSGSAGDNPFEAAGDGAFGAGSRVISGGGVGSAIGSGQVGGGGRTSRSNPFEVAGDSTFGSGSRVVAGGGGGENQPVEPWNDPTVRTRCDEWLRLATPDLKPVPGAAWRYTAWGVAYNGRTVMQPTAPPSTTLSRYQWLYQQSAGLTSKQHGSLRNYIEGRRGGSTPGGGRNGGDRRGTGTGTGGAGGKPAATGIGARVKGHWIGAAPVWVIYDEDNGKQERFPIPGGPHKIRIEIKEAQPGCYRLEVSKDTQFAWGADLTVGNRPNTMIGSKLHIVKDQDFSVTYNDRVELELINSGTLRAVFKRRPVKIARLRASEREWTLRGMEIEGELRRGKKFIARKKVLK